MSGNEHLLRAQTLAAPPRSAAEREFCGELLWANLRRRFEQNLSAADKRLWERPPADVRTSATHVQLLKSFDDFLLAQFRHYGPALFMSYGTLQRIFEWRRHEPHRMGLLARELELNSRVVREDPEARFPITSEFGRFKRESKEELTLLFSKIRTEFSFKNRRDRASIVGCIEDVVKQQPGTFPGLRRALAQLKEFLLAAPEHLVLGIVNGRTRAPSFVDTWIASATGYSVQRARQEMSRSHR